MAVDPAVGQGSILVAAECDDGLDHVLGVEDLQPRQQMKIGHRQLPLGLEFLLFGGKLFLLLGR